MYDEFLNNNIHQPKIFHNKSTKIIPKKKRSIIQNQNKKRKCHSFDNNKEQIERNLNISNKIYFPLSESISIISFSKEDFKNIDEQNSFNFKDNSKNDSFLAQEGPKITRISRSNTVNFSQKMAKIRQNFLNISKNDEEIQKKKTKIKRPNYLIKSCFYNNSDINKNYGRSLSKKESSPVMDFYIYQDKNDFNNNDNVIKKYYKRSTFGKTNKVNNDLDNLIKKDENKLYNKKDFNNINEGQNPYQSINKNNHNNEESFIKIIQADSSDDGNHEVKSFLEDKNDFANEIDIINKIKDKEDTLSNLINVSFKSQILEKHNYLNESMNYKNNSINFSEPNFSEGLSNSIYSNRSLNDEFVFRNHSKIFKPKNNNSINKNIEDKINNENNNTNKSDRQNILSYLKNDINNNQNYNNDYSEEELENNNHFNNINNNLNNLKLYEENNYNTINYFKSNQNGELNNLYLNQNNFINNNNQNIYPNTFNNINNYSININQFYSNKNNINNLNNNYLPNLNSFNYGNNLPNPFINNTINFIYNSNMNLIYNNTYNNENKNPKLNNNNNFLVNNNFNYNYYPNQFNNFNFSNPINQINNANIIPKLNNSFNNPNNIYYYQNNNNLNFNNINNNMNQKKNIKENKNNNNFNNNKIIPKTKDYTKMSNEELAKQAHNLSKTQDGCRFLEKIIDSNPINQINNANIMPKLNSSLNNPNNIYYYQNNNNLNFNNINNNINQKKNIKENKNNNNFNNNKIIPKNKDYTKMSNEELAKQAHNLSKTQDGCRFLEKIIDSNPSLVSSLFFPYTLGYFEELSNNKYGNFYIKKLIKHLSKELLAKLIEFISPMISKIGTNQYGGKIMEQLIKSIKDDDNLLLSFIKEIIPHLVLLINDLNGTHIIYKLLLLKSKYIRIIEEHICNNIPNIYITREGSNLLKKYFDIINKECNNSKNYEKIIGFIKVISKNLSLIIIDQFGNYIIRHLILNLNHSINNVIVQNIINNIVYYSNQKYSSNVVENCLDNNFIREYILNELTKQYIFNNIFLNEYGNYVIQKALSLADEDKKDIYFKYIIQVTRPLQSFPFGHKLLSKLLMLYPKLSMYILSIYK